jgi:hypothetical protein
MDNIRIIRYSQTSSTATLNLERSLTTRLDPDKGPHKHGQLWQGTGAELKAGVEEELRRYKMHFERKAD